MEGLQKSNPTVRMNTHLAGHQVCGKEQLFRKWQHFGAKGTYVHFKSLPSHLHQLFSDLDSKYSIIVLPLNHRTGIESPCVEAVTNSMRIQKHPWGEVE